MTSRLVNNPYFLGDKMIEERTVTPFMIKNNRLVLKFKTHIYSLHLDSAIVIDIYTEADLLVKHP